MRLGNCLPVLGALLSLFALLPTATAQESAAVLASGSRAQTSGWWAGVGPSVPTTSVSYRTLGLLSYRIAYPIPLPRGHYWFGDSFWEYQMEVPLYFVHQATSAIGIGATPIGFRLVTRGHSRLRPFIGGLAGVLFANHQIPESASRLNFSPQGEVGFEFGDSLHHEIHFEARYVHISNASIFHPNPGLNSILFLIGRNF